MQTPSSISDLQTAQNRFAVLATPRFRMFAPDALELRWNVFDTEEKRTVGFGHSPESAADVAFDFCRRNNIHLTSRSYTYHSARREASNDPDTAAD